MSPVRGIALIIASAAATAPAAITVTDLYTLGEVDGTFSIARPGGFQASGGQVIGIGEVYGPDDPQRALLWTPTQPNGIDLNPAGSAESRAHAVADNQQVGLTRTVVQGPSRATLWTGTAASAVNLHPGGFTTSEADGTDGVRQVGSAGTATSTHAMLWAGTAASVVDLHPAAGYTDTTAVGIRDGQQVGYGFLPSGRVAHALLWTGSAGSVVDLHPAGFTSSSALGVGNGVQVGTGSTAPPEYATNYHALMWTGTAASAVDLTPAGFATAQAFAADGPWQVGYAAPGLPGYADEHAMLWRGSADSAIDLHALLPGGFVWSYASGIKGDTVYGTALDATGFYHELVWTIPEPGCLTPLIAIAAPLARRRRRRRRPPVSS